MSYVMRLKLERGMILTENRTVSVYARNRVRRELRMRAKLMAHGEHFPKNLQLAKISMTFMWHDPRRRRDVANWMPTAKPIVDGLIDYGLLPDDSNRYLMGPFLHSSDAETPPPGVTWVDVEVIDWNAPDAGPGVRSVA